MESEEFLCFNNEIKSAGTLKDRNGPVTPYPPFDDNDDNGMQGLLMIRGREKRIGKKTLMSVQVFLGSGEFLSSGYEIESTCMINEGTLPAPPATQKVSAIMM
jgi:hypothetical protein